MNAMEIDEPNDFDLHEMIIPWSHHPDSLTSYFDP